MSRFSRPRCLFQALLVAFVCFFPAIPFLPAQTATSNPDAAFDIQPSTSLDEELFLIDALYDIHRRWPAPDDPQVAHWITLTSTRISNLRGTVSDHHLSRDLAAAFDDYSNLLRAYDQYLTNLGIIDQQTGDRVVNEALGAILDGGVEAGKKKFTGSTDDEAKDAGEAEAMGSALKRAFNVYGERRSALLAEGEKLRSQSDAIRNDITNIAQRLTRDRNWHPGEAGFDSYASGDIGQQVKQRPRDPFALYRYATNQSENETSAAGASQRSDWCIQAAQLVPAGRDYDGYRAFFIGQATHFSLLAVSLEAPQGYSTGPAASSPQALHLARTYLYLQPGDQNGFGHMELARALASAGRYNEALTAAQVASKTYGEDPGFAFRGARLLSLAGEAEKAGQQILYAYSLGWSDVNSVRTSPDFNNLRRSQPRQFADLVSVRMSPPEIVWGIFMDDIVLTNQSAFDLTNVRSHVWIRQGDRTWNVAVNCQKILAGKSCKAENAVTVPNDRYDEMKIVDFDCDQLGR